MKTLRKLALAGSISLAAVPSAQAAGTLVRQWSDAPMRVSQYRADDGSQSCFFPITANAAVWLGLSKNDHGETKVGIKQPGSNWTTGGTVTFLIDGTSFNIFMEPTAAGRDALYSQDISSQTDFLHALYNGNLLTISVGNAAQGNYPLSGTATAITMLNRCAETVMAMANPVPAPAAAPSPSAQPAPVYQPVPLQLPMPASQPASSQAGSTEVTLIQAGTDLFLPVTINGTNTATFHLDTGASDVTIPKSLALRLVAQGTLTASDYLGKGNYQIADGSTHTFPNYRLRSVTVGGRTATNVRCSVGNDDHTLLLGQSFLKKFSSYTIDNTRNVLVLND